MKKPNGKVEEKAQPIPSEKLKDFRIRELELQQAQTQVQTMLAAANSDFVALCNAHGVNREHWEFDLRAGTMKRKAGEKKDHAHRGPRKRAEEVLPPAPPAEN